MHRIVLSILFTIISVGGFAQADNYPNSAEIYQRIKKLNVLGSVLYIAAHPDDENTKLLAWLANEKLYRTGYLSVTRGDGGQNLIGEELGVPLGLIRTRELLAARRIDGAEQFFTRAFDFGFSKSPEETFRIWDKEKILSDVVWVIRKFQPDVIITRFPTTGEGGHGHHTASAILASEAFAAAADKNRFPEHFRYGVKAWQAKRLLWNTFRFGSVNTTDKSQFNVDVGGYNPLLGESYGELAALSRSEHKSQGFGVASSRGKAPEYFKTVLGEEPKQDLMDGVVTHWGRLNIPAFSQLVNEITAGYDFQRPQGSLTLLSRLHRELQKVEPGYWRNQKLREIEELLRDCAGLFVEAAAGSAYLVPGDTSQITLTINKRAGGNVQIKSAKIFNTFFMVNQVLPLNDNLRYQVPVPVPANTPVSQPYWLQKEMQAGSFTVDDQTLIGQAWNEPQAAEVVASINGTDVALQVPLIYKNTDPVKGEQIRQIAIVPPFEVRVLPQMALSVNRDTVTTHIETKLNTRNGTYDTLFTYVTPGVSQSRKENDFSYVVQGNEKKQTRYVLRRGNEQFDQYKTEINYDHIPPIVYFSNARLQLIPVEVEIAGKRVGYIPGAGDKIPDALKDLGYEVVVLKENLTPRDLVDLDAVVTGVRAYNVHDWLAQKHDLLMDYVRNGGVVLVQYNTNSNAGPLKEMMGPEPFTISRNRVTDEQAPVVFIDPSNALLNYPNQITENDFKGWIQERSLYHADVTPAYQTLLSMSDPGERPDDGSLIYLNVGKGRFIYTGLSFFRQLPAGVPGAFRLFANLLAPPKKES